MAQQGISLVCYPTTHVLYNHALPDDPVRTIRRSGTVQDASIPRAHNSLTEL